MGQILIVHNGPMPTTAIMPSVATGTAIITLLQLKPFNTCRIIEWGIQFDGYSAAAPVAVELIDTGTVFGTVTAYADADIMKYDGADGAVASIAGLTLGTTASGYTASAEGTITATKVFDHQLIAPSAQYVKQFPLGREPKLIIGNALRIRVKAAATVNANCYVVLEF
ncbi:MAG: hypothetical protein WAW75_02925 [Gallionella sp.]